MLSMKAKVVHCKKEKYDVLIDRTTKWGNPFKIGECYQGRKMTREDSIEAHRDWFLYSDQSIELQKDLHELEGKTLA